jgi:two-component system, OmpR family, alkaline phosphatase synthesis response regulator PhoP
MASRILVVDDDSQILRLLRSYLEQAGFEVLTAADGTLALRLIRTERPDLILLDLLLPDRDGWEITREVRSDSKVARTPIIMLTARVADTDKIVGLELGADDYITKPFNPHEVVARVRAVLRRANGGPITPHVLQVGGLRMDLDRHELSRGGTPIDLTPTEWAILQTLMEHPGHAFTRLQLIEQALGYSYDGFERAIDSHIKNLRKKIEVDPNRPAHIETVFGVGYRLRGDS